MLKIEKNIIKISEFARVFFRYTLTATRDFPSLFLRNSPSHSSSFLTQNSYFQPIPMKLKTTDSDKIKNNRLR